MVTEDTHSSYQKRYGYPTKYSFTNFTKLLVDEINFRFPDLEKKELRTTSPLRDKIFSISHYESIISFNINKNKCRENTLVKNGGLKEGETHSFNYLEKSSLKKVLVYLSKKLKFLKKYRLIYSMVYKFHHILNLRLRRKQNRTNKKFFSVHKSSQLSY